MLRLLGGHGSSCCAGTRERTTGNLVELRQKRLFAGAKGDPWDALVHRRLSLRERILAFPFAASRLCVKCSKIGRSAPSNRRTRRSRRSRKPATTFAVFNSCSNEDRAQPPLEAPPASAIRALCDLLFSCLFRIRSADHQMTGPAGGRLAVRFLRVFPFEDLLAFAEELRVGGSRHMYVVMRLRASSSCSASVPPGFSGPSGGRGNREAMGTNS
jgi:hypothetical protein